MRAYRSPLKLFVFGVVGIVLIAAAADVAFGHWLSTPPDSNSGVLTTRGLAQQRGDLLWSGAMMMAGVLLFGGAITELVRRKPVVAVEGEGIVISASGDGAPIPWSAIESVSSDVESDPFDGSGREQFVIDLVPGSPAVPEAPGMTSDGDTVRVDAHDWATSVTEVALAAQGAHDHYRRMETVRTYEEPSIVWEVTVDQTDAGDATQSTEAEDAPEMEDEE